MYEVTTSEAHSSNSTTSPSNEGNEVMGSEVNSSNSATKVIVHMHGINKIKFKTNTVTKLMWKHKRGEKLLPLSQTNVTGLLDQNSNVRSGITVQVNNQIKPKLSREY